MKKVFTTLVALAAASSIQAAVIPLIIKDEAKQHVTGFGAACCDGAMKPYGTETAPVKLLYDPQYKICLNIMRAEISPSHNGDDYHGIATISDGDAIKIIIHYRKVEETRREIGYSIEVEPVE